MANIIPLHEIGNTYGILTITGIEPSDKISTRVTVRCGCGTSKTVKLTNLRSGNTKSCGCVRLLNVTKACTTHGFNNTPLHKLYQTMKGRCFTKKSKAYKNYGGRGITVCEDWLNDFVAFKNWCESNGYKKGLQLDRIDNDKNYGPENCRFVTPSVNLRNKRNNLYVIYKGEKMLQIELLKTAKVSQAVFYRRLRDGWSVEDAVHEGNRRGLGRLR